MTLPASVIPHEYARFSPAYKTKLLVLSLLVAALAYVDRVLIQTLAQPIKEDLGLTDFQFGILSGLGFAVLYSTLALPIARLSERRDRITIIAVSVGIFSMMALLCGLAASFLQTLVCRIGVGIGEAGVQSPCTSLISDHFPVDQRGFALTVMRLGAPLGSVIGSLFGAWIARDFGWRAAMITIAGPGLLIAVVFRVILRDPRHGPPDSSRIRALPGMPLPEVFGFFLRRAEFRHILAGLALTTMGLYAGGAFTSLFFMRVHGLSLTQASVYFAILTGVASTVGMTLGGLGVDFVARKDKRWYALLPCIGVALCVLLYSVGYSLNSAPLSLLCLSTAGISLFLHSMPLLVAFQNLVAPSMRTTAAFVYFLVSTLVGVGFGPPLIGLVSDVYASHAIGGAFTTLCPGHHLTDACMRASSIGLRRALITSLILYAWAAIHFWIAAKRLGASNAEGFIHG